MDKPQGTIKITCGDEDDYWRFSISDNGPGIEERYFEKIFQMFQTLAARDEFESTGVGLTVVKKIVEMYGGKIWVESKVGQGSTFSFTLPKQQTETDNAGRQANTAH
jgi:signal transduction histidine kinase